MILVGDTFGVEKVKKAMLKPERVEYELIVGTEDASIFIPNEYIRDGIIIIICYFEIKGTRSIEASIKEFVKTNNLKWQIVNFFDIYRAYIPTAVCDRISIMDGRTYEGLLLGISHAEVGILANRLKVPVYNTAVSSQDLYFNWCSFKYIMEKYGDKINLKYLLIDLYNYNYFNYDTSVTQYGDYLFGGGFPYDLHNYEKTYSKKYYNGDLEEIKEVIITNKLGTVNEEKIEIFESLFPGAHAKLDFWGCYQEDYVIFRNRIIEGKDLYDYKYDIGIVNKRFLNTLEENKHAFENILQLAYEINPKVKIFCFLMPRYYKSQEMAKSYMEKWQREFYDIISQTQRKYPFVFKDYKFHEMSKERNFFYDASHFNYMGAEYFTEVLNKDFFKFINYIVLQPGILQYSKV